MINALNHIHFTSDILFRCKSKASIREYASISDMENAIIDQWNSHILPTDHVYYLGNFAKIVEGAAQSYSNLIYELNGFKHFIMGPKDHLNVFESLKGDSNLNIVEVTNYKELMILKQRIVLMHYPIQEWNGKSHIRSAIHLHGGELITEPYPSRFNISFDNEQKIYSGQDILGMYNAKCNDNSVKEVQS